MQEVQAKSALRQAAEALEKERAPRVLIVEDSPTQAKLISISLRRLGIEVEYAACLQEVLPYISPSVAPSIAKIDVILLDLSLPDSMGIATFHRVHAISKDIPIVVLTSLDDQKIAIAAMKGGAQDYLIKGRASDDSIVRCLRYAIERNRVELALRESDRRTHLMIENSLDAFVSFDRQGYIVDWNRQAEKTFGWSANEAIGKKVDELILVPSDQLPRIYFNTEGNSCGLNFDAPLIDGGISLLNKRIEIPIRDKNDRHFPAEVGLFTVGESDNLIYCAFINDITERKENERKRKKINEELEIRVQERTKELSRSNEELEQFAKIASHDLQEPLRAVQGFADLLATRYRDKLDQDANDFIGFILDGTERMQRLIRAVLEHSSIKATDVAAAPIVDANEIIREVIFNLNQAIEESDAQVEIGSIPKLCIERSQLTQLFQNLIGNAIKYRGSEAPKIKISAELNVSEWLFSVQDNGIGVDPRFAQKIFDMFARLHGGTKYAGTGMGLAICKKIVTAHGGRIWMESEPGQGSIFFFTLPAALVAKEEVNER